LATAEALIRAPSRPEQSLTVLAHGFFIYYTVSLRVFLFVILMV